jgi:hypothetical protein
LDRALAERSLRITSAGDAPLAGTWDLAVDGKQGTFTPAQPWSAGAYVLHIASDLEDVAGNRIDRAFDADLSAPIEARPVQRRAFVVGK